MTVVIKVHFVLSINGRINPTNPNGCVNVKKNIPKGLMIAAGFCYEGKSKLKNYKVNLFRYQQNTLESLFEI